MKVILNIVLICLLIQFASAESRKVGLRYSSVAVASLRTMERAPVGPNMEDLVSVYCADATNFDGSVYIYNRCGCPIIVQLGITLGYWSTDFNITTVIIPGWSPSITSSSGKPNNAVFLLRDPNWESDVEVFSVNPYQSSTPCQPFAMGCLTVSNYLNPTTQDFSFALFNKCPVPIQALYICDNMDSTIRQSHQATVQPWDQSAVHSLNTLPKNAVWTVCSDGNLDMDVILMATIPQIPPNH